MPTNRATSDANDPFLLRVLLRTARPPFLILSPISVLLGMATAQAAGDRIDYGMLALLLLAAISAHISINTLNEYQDFKSGLDYRTKRTSFSGGSGALIAYPQAATKVLMTSAVALSVTMLVGLYFIWLRGLPVALIGIVGITLILTYTQWLNRHPWACLIAPGLGFGSLMVLGSHYVLAGSISLAAWLAAMLPFFLVNNLLLLNQYPDIMADRESGRRHFPIAHGVSVSNLVYGAFLLAACLTLAVGIGTGVFPRLATISLLPMLLSVYALNGAFRHQGDIGNHPHYLGANAAAAVSAPLLLAVAIAWS